MHSVKVVDISPVGLLYVSLICDTLVEPLVSAVDAVIEHALLAQAVVLVEFIFESAGIAISEVSVLRNLTCSDLSIANSVLVAVGIESHDAPSAFSSILCGLNHTEVLSELTPVFRMGANFDRPVCPPWVSSPLPSFGHEFNEVFWDVLWVVGESAGCYSCKNSEFHL